MKPGTRKSILTILLVTLLSPMVLQAEDSEPVARHGDVAGAGLPGPRSSGAQVAGNSGGARYNIPIEAAPGRHGVQPKLSLSYSSRDRSHGAFGLGWSLQGGGAIVRVGRRNGPPNYDSTDEFRLTLGEASSRLVWNEATGRYHTEQESFLLIQYDETNRYWTVKDKSGVLHVFGFGFDEQRRDTQSFDPANPQRIHIWHLDRLIDPNGNYITFQYVKDLNQTYLHKVSYTGHIDPGRRLNFAEITPGRIPQARELEFEYEVRPDHTTSYQAGFLMTTRQRAHNIIVRLNGGRVRRYALYYRAGQAPARASLLGPVQEYGRGDWASLPPTLFEYSQNNTQTKWVPTDPAAFQPGDVPFHPFFHVSHGNSDSGSDVPRSPELGFRLVDVNGDGCPDILHSWNQTSTPPPDGDQGWVDWRDSGPHQHREVWLSDCKGGWLREPRYDLPADLAFVEEHHLNNRPGMFTADCGVRLADLNGDGFTDIVQSYANGAGVAACRVPLAETRRRVWINRGAAPCESPGCKWILVAETIGPEEFRSFLPPAVFTVVGDHPRRNDDYGFHVLDVSGDGLADILFRHSQRPCPGEGCGAWINTGTPSRVPSSAWRWAPEYAPPVDFVWWGNDEAHSRLDLGVRFLDVNGDGLVDMVQALDCGHLGGSGFGPCDSQDPRYRPYTNRVWLNRGSGVGWQAAWSSESEGAPYKPPEWIGLEHFYFTKWADNPRRSEAAPMVLADVNGDGLTDLVYSTKQGLGPVGGFTWLNKGRPGSPEQPSWEADDRYNLPEAFQQHIRGIHSVSRGLRLEADFNGDGLPDLLQNYASHMPGAEETHQRAWRNNTGHEEAGRRLTRYPDLLVKVTTPMGGVTEIRYIASTQVPDAHCHPQAGVENPNPELPMVFPVVCSITSQPGIAGQPDIPTYYTFSGGKVYSDPRRQEFLGFRQVTISGWLETETDGDKPVVHATDYFQTLWNRSPETSQVRLCAGPACTPSNQKLFARSEFTYRDLGPNPSAPYFAPLEAKTEYTCDGLAPARLPECKPTRTEFIYDAYGNLEMEKQHGEVGVGPQRSVKRVFSSGAPANRQNWMLGYLLEEETYDGWADAGGTLMARRRITYDRVTPDTPFDHIDAQGRVRNDTPLIRGHVTGVHRVCWRCSATQQDVWRTTKSRHDIYGNVTKITDPLDHESTRAYDPSGYRLTQSINAAGQATAFYYHPTFALVTYVQDPNQCWDKVDYDDFGRQIRHYACHRYTVRGEEVEGYVEDPQYAPSTAFDYRVEPVAGRSALTKVMPLDYTATTLRESFTFTTQVYDGLGRVIQTQTKSEEVNKYILATTIYNQSGLVSKVTIPEKVSPPEDAVYIPYTTPFFTRTFYDALGRVIKVIHPDGTFRTTKYDRWIVTQTDENGKPKIFYHDAYGRLVRVDEKNEGDTYSTQHEYDALGRLLKTTHRAHLSSPERTGGESPFSTQFRYNSLGEKTSLVDPDMGEWTYTYDAAGNLETQTDARGNTLTFWYDALNRLREKRYPEGRACDGRTPGTCPSIRYTYDQCPGCLGPAPCRNGMGRLCQIEDHAGTREFAYDKKGRTTKTTYRIGPNSYTLETSKYTPGDQLLEKKYPDGETMTYAYNERQLLRRIGDESSESRYVTSIIYNEVGKPQTVGYANGLQTEYFYFDPPRTPARVNFRLQQIKTSNNGPAPGTTVHQDLSYDYDHVGNVQSVNGRLDAVAINQTFLYDDLYRLKEARGLSEYGTLNFKYNDIGNLLEKDRRSYAYNGLLPHAVTSVTGPEWTAGYEYDENGNLKQSTVNGQVKQFIYDYDNRLIERRDRSDMPLEQFVYNDVGQRVMKIIGPLGAPEKTLYLDGGSYIIEPSGKIVKYIAGYLKREKRLTQASVYYFHSDLLGSTSLITDAQGQIAEVALYKPYGEIYVNMPNIHERFQFTSQELDPETGLYYYGARYYDPVLGRFISADPAGVDEDDPQTLNRYAYALNNPTTRIDPDGNVSFGNILGAAVGVASIVLSGGATLPMALGIAQVVTNVGAAAGVLPPWTASVANIANAAYIGYNTPGVVPDTTLGVPGAVAAAGAQAVVEFAYPDRLKRAISLFPSFDSPLSTPGTLPPGYTPDFSFDNKDGREALDFALGFVPVLGSILNIGEAVAGRDLAGNKLKGWERGAAVLAAAPIIGPLGKGVGKGAKLVKSMHANRALTLAERWLGKYEQISPGVFRSVDGRRQFRMTTSDLIGHATHNKFPHVHFQKVAPDGRTLTTIRTIRIIE